jgi:hypothetical protein
VNVRIIDRNLLILIYSFSLARATASTVPKTAWNNPPKSPTTVSGRSQSEYPTPTEAISQLSLESGSTSGARSQTTRPTYQRRILRSAVPDSAVLAIINQYDIEITMIRRDGKSCGARKNERWETLQQLAKREKNFPIAW